MSARSCWVTCGIVVQATLRCSAVLRRTARIGCRSISPQREKSGSGSAGAGRRRRRPRRRRDQPLGVRLDVVDRDPAGRTAARHLIDVDAELARHAAHRRRRGRDGQLGRPARLGGRPRAAVDVDDFVGPDRLRAARVQGARLVVGRSVGGCRSPARRRRRRRRGAAVGGSAAARRLRLAASGVAALRRRRRPEPRRRSSSTLRIAWPTLTLSPALTLMSFTCPATDDGTSMVALSVSSSRTGWSFDQRVARLHEHAQHVAGGDVLAELRECEVDHVRRSVTTTRGTSRESALALHRVRSSLDALTRLPDSASPD